MLSLAKIGGRGRAHPRQHRHRAPDRHLPPRLVGQGAFQRLHPGFQVARHLGWGALVGLPYSPAGEAGAGEQGGGREAQGELAADGKGQGHALLPRSAEGLG
jgi:hypothetical protein